MLGIVIAIGIGMLALERLRPGWELPRVPTWLPRAIAANVVQLGVVLLAGLTWDRLVRGHSVFELGASLGPWAGGAVAYLVATFVYYWWHRARHASRPLWLGLHQLHHSAQRIEIITSFYKHPAEQAANAVLSSIITYVLLGLTPAGAAVYTLFSAIGEFIYHMNIRTPRWLGFIFQRPEMHRIHHEHGRHGGNYGDLPIWDMLFGTYENPETFEGKCGFDPEREERVGAMLAFRDVHADGERDGGLDRSAGPSIASADPGSKPSANEAPLNEPKRPIARAARAAAIAALLALGLSSIGGTLLEAVAPSIGRALAGAGKLSLASPFPKVFCRVGEEEPFGFEHVIDLELASGEILRVRADRSRYAKFTAPYQTRNVYGAVFAFAPRLREETARAVVTHGFCGGGPLLALAGEVGSSSPVVAVTVLSSPRKGALGAPRSMRFQCPV
jgi:sterol desaturase/sphingolipid hydroxylase (fatty acid hydroxylase superfamily)